MKNPDINPALKLVEDEETRRRLNFAYLTRALENGPIIEKVVALKHEMALLLGFNSYSEYAL
jgi:Zn-dependent oligopeptidase